MLRKSAEQILVQWDRIKCNKFETMIRDRMYSAASEQQKEKKKMKIEMCEKWSITIVFSFAAIDSQ